MKIADLASHQLAARLRRPGLWYRTGPFLFHVKTGLPQIAAGIHSLYQDFPYLESSDYADFHVSFSRPSNLRRWFRPQIRFLFDGASPFVAVPDAQAFAMFEWCCNWCISMHANQFLITHGAAVERWGYAAILPGPPGSGKSTLCAALVANGWRLLTDELTLIDPDTTRIVPLARPIALKNQSIEVIRSIAPQTAFGPPSHDTAKGTVAHMRPPTDSVTRANERASPGWVIFPKYKPNCRLSAAAAARGETFMWFAGNSFNYTILGSRGFETLSRLIDEVDCFTLNYSDLDEAIAWFDRLEAPKSSVGSAGR